MMRSYSFQGKKIIGKGAFTTAYLTDDGKEVLLKSNDPIKLCASEITLSGHRLFPKIEKLDNGVYKMKYYPRVTSLKKNLTPRQYGFYRELRTLYEEELQWGNISFNEVATAITTISSKYKTEREAVLDAFYNCSAYTKTPYMEISPRNVAVHNGKLILLDIFFCSEQLNKNQSK